LMKKAQTSAGSIATLVALIALFIILYVLLLPQEKRDTLLEGRPGEERGIGEEGEVLVSKFIGEINVGLQEGSVMHSIPAANLFTRVEKETIDVSDTLRVSSSLFSSNSQNLVFNLDNPGNIKDASFYVFVTKSKGDLILKLNNREIYRNDVAEGGQEIIEFPASSLEERNTLEVISSRPRFFGSNEHEIQYIKLRIEKLSSSKEALRTFSIPNSEMRDLEKAILHYNVFCSSGAEEDVLNMFVNSKLIFSDVPICNRRGDDLEIGRDDLKTGTNILEFKTEVGDYLIDNIELESILKREMEFSESFFFLDEESFKAVRTGGKSVIIKIEFGDNVNRKVMDIEVNDNKIEVDTQRKEFTVTVSSKINEGDNIVRLTPRNSFEILSLEVRLV
jgi:hypothetical protein